MSFFLDTNICIYALKGRFPSISQRIQALTPSDIKIPALVQAELLLGAEKSRRRDETMEIVERFLFPFDIIPFCERAARSYATIRATLESRGQPIGPNDLIIAATALAHGAILITHNSSEFSRVEGLLCDDWTQDPQA